MVFKPEFVSGALFMENLQCYLAPQNVFLCALNEINNNIETETARKILRDSSKIDCEIIYNSLKDLKVRPIDKIKVLLKYLISLGNGEITILKASQTGLIFTQKTAILTNNYVRLYKKEPNLLFEEVNLGYLVNFSKLLFGKEVFGRITKTSNTLKYELKFGKSLTLNLKNYKYNKAEISDRKTNKLLKVIMDEQLKNVNGICSLWNCYAIFIPFFYFIEMINKSEKLIPGFYDELGYMLGKCCVDLQRQLFGVKEKLFEAVIEQTELVGSGKTEYKLTDKNLDFRYINNVNYNFRDFYDKNMLVRSSAYFENIIKGIYDFVYDTNSDIINLSNSEVVLKANNKKPELSQREDKIQEILLIPMLVIKK